jgi:hypothetical protein
VQVEAHGPKRPGQRCRDSTRPTLSSHRVQRNTAKQVELKLTTPCRDGVASAAPRYRVMSPRRSRSGPPLRDPGVPAPNAKQRALPVPQVPAEAEKTNEPPAGGACAIGTGHARPRRFSRARPPCAHRTWLARAPWSDAQPADSGPASEAEAAAAIGSRGAIAAIAAIAATAAMDVIGAMSPS